MMNNNQLHPYDALFSQLRNVHPWKMTIQIIKKLLNCGLKTEEALSEMKFSKPPPSGEEN